MKPICAVELLIDKIKRDYKDDVAAVVIMGSTIYGESHARSDIDMYFIPKTDRADQLQFTFIIDGIGFDFWGISWERLERFANWDERLIVSIITEGRALWFSSEEDKAHFEAIREKALDVSDVSKFVWKADAKLGEAYRELYQLQKVQTLSEARMLAIGVIYKVTDALALLNRVSIKRGRGKLKGEILAMPLVPADFEKLYDTAFVSNDIGEIKAAYQALLENTQALISRESAKAAGAPAFSEVMEGFYEELINFYNKIYHAAEIGDAVTPLFACAEIDHEIEWAFKRAGASRDVLPDIAGAYDPKDLSKIEKAAQEHQAAFEALLEEKAVPVRRFRDYEELKAYLETR